MPAPSSELRYSILTDTTNAITKPQRSYVWLMRKSHLYCRGQHSFTAMRITSLGFGSYNTALLMYNKIRVALGNVEFKQLISYVEVDETYVGGKARNKHKGLGGRGDMGGTGGTEKTIVFGAVQRKGIARVQACAAVEPSLRRPRAAWLT